MNSVDIQKKDFYCERKQKNSIKNTFQFLL